MNWQQTDAVRIHSVVPWWCGVNDPLLLGDFGVVFPVNDHDSRHVLERIECMERVILERINYVMSAISDFATAVNAFFDRQDTAITDLQGDVKNLTDQIAALQASSGQITPADQALLDGIQARAKTVSDKLDALDALTPPVVPPTTP